MNRKNNRFTGAAFFLLLLFAGPTSSAFAQATTFTYQGRLQDGGANANGSYDFQFTLWDSLSGGTQQPQPLPLTLTKSTVAVANGVFTVQLDFGAGAFPGADRFLETSVRLSGTGTFTVLSPRQPITPTPYAIRSASAASADSVPVDSIPAGSANYIQNTVSQQANSKFNISGNGTVGGTLQANSVRAVSQYQIGNNSDPVLTAPGTNLFVGIGSGIANTGFNNAFLGSNVGRNNTSGANNTFVGAGAGTNNITGSSNSFLGLNAGGGNHGGGSNSFFGSFAGGFNTEGNQNSFFGQAAGGQVTTGSNNSFFGNTTGISTTVEFLNSLLGSFADTAPGISNATAIGARAKVTQSNSLVLGSVAGINNASFSTNVGIGTTAPSARLHVVGDTNLVGNLVVSGTLGVATVNGVLLSSAGNQNLFAGNGTGQSNTGQQNSAFGFSAGLANSTGNFNSFFGANSGAANNTGAANAFFGDSAGSKNTSGGNNAYFGSGSGANSTTSLSNAFFGASSGLLNVDGSQNSFLGYGTGIQNTSGGKNTFVGWSAGSLNLTGNSNTTVGFTANVASNNLSNATAIGANATVSQSNSLVLGSISGVNSATADTNVGIGTNAPTSRLHVIGNTNLVGNLTVSGGVGIGTASSAVALEVQRNSTVASNWQTGQLRISGASDPNMQLSLGYDTSSNLGVIQAGQAGVAFKNLSLNPSGGNVGIGNASPNFSLHVSGETRTQFLSIDNFVSNGGGPPLCASTTTNRVGLCSSSLRYKTNVRTFRDGLDIINRLRPISFNWKDGGMHDLGLAAEEVDRVEPLLAYRNKKGEVEGVKYNQLSAVFINAFKEQQAQIQDQQEQLRRQQEQIKRQENREREQHLDLAVQQREIESLKALLCRSHRNAKVCQPRRER